MNWRKVTRSRNPCQKRVSSCRSPSHQTQSIPRKTSARCRRRHPDCRQQALLGSHIMRAARPRRVLAFDNMTSFAWPRQLPREKGAGGSYFPRSAFLSLAIRDSCVLCRARTFENLTRASSGIGCSALGTPQPSGPSRRLRRSMTNTEGLAHGAFHWGEPGAWGAGWVLTTTVCRGASPSRILSLAPPQLHLSPPLC